MSAPKPPLKVELVWSSELQFGATSGRTAVAVDANGVTGPKLTDSRSNEKFPDVGELQTALRECAEECGIALVAIEGKPLEATYRLPSGRSKSVMPGNRK